MRRHKTRGAAALLLTLCLAIGLMVPALGAEGTVTVSYEALEELVTAGSPQVEETRQTYARMALELAELEQTHKDLLDSGAPLDAVAAVAMQLQREIKALRRALESEDESARRAAQAQLCLVRLRYLEQYRLEGQAEQARRGLAWAQEQLRDAEAAVRIGAAAQREADAARRQVEDSREALRQLEEACRRNRAALADTLGVTGEITLAGLPEFSPELVDGRDAEADEAAYLLAAPGVRQRQAELEQAQIALKLLDNKATRYAVQAAKENYAQAQEAAARDFQEELRALREAHEALLVSTQEEDARADYARLQRLYQAGLVSRRQVREAEEVLEQTLLTLRQREIALLQALVTYETNLQPWTWDN